MNRQQRRAAAKHKPGRVPGRYPAVPDAAWQLLMLNRPYDESETLKDNIAIRMTVNNLANGDCTEDDFNRLATAINLVTLIANEHNQHLHTLTMPVHQAMISIKKRYEKWGKWDLTTSEKEQMQIGADLVAEIMLHTTPLQLQRASRQLAYIRGKTELEPAQ